MFDSPARRHLIDTVVMEVLIGMFGSPARRHLIDTVVLESDRANHLRALARKAAKRYYECITGSLHI